MEVNGFIIRNREWYQRLQERYVSGVEFGRFDQKERVWLYYAEMRWYRKIEEDQLSFELLFYSGGMNMLLLYLDIIQRIAILSMQYTPLPFITVVAMLSNNGFVDVSL